MSATQKQKDKQLGLIDEIGLEQILNILGQDQGFNALALTLYEAVATQAQELEVERLFAVGNTAKANHLQEAINDLQALVSKLEPVSSYSVVEAPRPRDHEEILAANVEFSLPDILLAFVLGFGVNRTLGSFIKVAEGLAQHYRDLSGELSKAKPSKLPGQEDYTHKVYERKADRLQVLASGLKSVLVVYQTNKNTPLQQLIETLDKEEKELCA